MRFDLFEGARKVGTVAWEGPGRVRMEVGEEADRVFLTGYFAGDAVYLASVFEEDGEAFHVNRRDSSPWEFERACRALSAMRAYDVVASRPGPAPAPPRSGHEGAW